MNKSYMIAGAATAAVAGAFTLWRRREISVYNELIAANPLVLPSERQKLQETYIPFFGFKTGETAYDSTASLFKSATSDNPQLADLFVLPAAVVQIAQQLGKKS